MIIKTVMKQYRECLTGNTKAIKKFVEDYIGEVRVCKCADNFEKVESFKNEPQLLFDIKTKNFHVFPDKNLYCKNNLQPQSKDEKLNVVLSNEIAEKRTTLLIAFYYLLKNEEVSEELAKEFNRFYNTDSIALFCERYKEKSEKKIYRYGKGAATGANAKKYDNLYKYISINYHGRCYNLNFMRFNQANNRINCDFKSLQYDCCSNEDGNINICKDNIAVCYPDSGEKERVGIISSKDQTAINICYNPNISYYATEEMILKNFIKFINVCDELVSKKDDDLVDKLRVEMRNSDF